MKEHKIKPQAKPRFTFRLKVSDVTLTGWAIVAVNAAMIAGIFIFGWQPLYIVAVYMAESFIVGIFNAIKIAVSLWQGIPTTTNFKSNVKGWWLLPFFLLHYNVFIGIQFGIFLGFVGFGNTGGANIVENLGLFFGTSGILALAGMVITHMFLFIKDYLQSGDYRVLAPNTLMMQPYSRVFVQQFVVIFGGFFAVFLGFMSFISQRPDGAAVGYAVLLIILKTYADLLAHRKAASGMENITAPLPG